MNEILQKLKAWRQEQSNLEKIEPFRVLSHSAIEEIAKTMPRDRKGLLEIKGVKEKKFQK